MKCNASPGEDDIGPAYYKECDLSLTFALCDFYTYSMDNIYRDTRWIFVFQSNYYIEKQGFH